MSQTYACRRSVQSGRIATRTRTRWALKRELLTPGTHCPRGGADTRYVFELQRGPGVRGSHAHVTLT